MLIAYLQKGQPFPMFVKFKAWHIAQIWILCWWMVHHIPSGDLTYSYAFQHFQVCNRTHTYIYNIHIMLYIHLYMYILYSKVDLSWMFHMIHQLLGGCSDKSQHQRLISSRSILANYSNLSKIIFRKWPWKKINFLLPTVWPFWKHCLWKKAICSLCRSLNFIYRKGLSAINWVCV